MTLVANNLETTVQPKAVKAGKTAKGTERNLNAQTRLKNAWAVAKAQGLKMLTKACFGVQTTTTMEENEVFFTVSEVRNFCIDILQGSTAVYLEKEKAVKMLQACISRQDGATETEVKKMYSLFEPCNGFFVGFEKKKSILLKLRDRK